MKYNLKDGTEIEILDSPATIPVIEFQRYINSLIGEGSWVLLTEKVTLKEEKKWKKGLLSNIRKGKSAYTLAVYNGKVAGMSDATRQIGRNKGNVVIGLGVTKRFRRKGLGEYLLKSAIKKAKKKFNPKNIYLTVAEPNKPARELYEKVGFRKVARFPDWIENKGKYHAELLMVLKKNLI